MMAAANVFSRIPMPTWRRLGVNDLPVPDGLTLPAAPIQLSAAAGECVHHVVELRESGAQEIEVTVADGAELSLTYIQLAPTDAPAASRIHAVVGKGGRFSCTIVEAGAQHTASELQVTLAGDQACAHVWSLYFGDDAR